MKVSKKIKGLKINTSVPVRATREYANDPFFLKKAADAKAFLLKNGLPKELVDQGIKIEE
jgi:hypothetical protein